MTFFPYANLFPSRSNCTLKVKLRDMYFVAIVYKLIKDLQNYDTLSVYILAIHRRSKPFPKF